MSCSTLIATIASTAGIQTNTRPPRSSPASLQLPIGSAHAFRVYNLLAGLGRDAVGGGSHAQVFSEAGRDEMPGVQRNRISGRQAAHAAGPQNLPGTLRKVRRQRLGGGHELRRSRRAGRGWPATTCSSPNQRGSSSPRNGFAVIARGARPSSGRASKDGHGHRLSRPSFETPRKARGSSG
ncbi:MAG: hypothetical protein QOJ86_1532 [Bradyrhizobium sp.]|nr:hypothetical protein [Bradyrhizobium sp.]